MRLTQERLLEVLPEIGEVKDPAWRESCIRIWQEAFEDTCWDDILDAPNNPSVPEDTLIRHTRSVVHGTRVLAASIAADENAVIHEDRLLVIGLLHDVCKLVELERVDGIVRKSVKGERYPHGYFSGQLAMKYGLPDEICASLVGHSQFVKNVPPTLEGVIMCYADLAAADAVLFGQGMPLLLNYCKI